MKYDVCPNCGGTVRAESIGWKCNNCRGFISLQDGKFYEYVEKPFMPPMTNADRIRAMSDEELARTFTNFFVAVTEANDIPVVLDDNFELDHLEFLKQPAKEVSNDTT